MNRFQAWYRAQPRALRALLTINVVLYVVWQFVLIHIDVVYRFVYQHLALNPELPGILFEPWQLLTYNFLHLSPGLGGFLHVLFNMLWLVWIGRDYEELYGPHRLLSAYLLGGLGGGLLTVLLNVVFPEAIFGATVHGASASVLGVLTTVAVLHPDKSIALLFIGTVRLIWVVVAFLVLDLLFIAGSNTSISAHLGGAFTGFLLARAEGSGTDLSSWARIFFRDRRRAAPRPAPRSSEAETGGGVLARLDRWLGSRSRRKGQPKPKPDKKKPSGKARITRLRPTRSYETAGEGPEDSGLESEVDRILDKISEEGYDALTEEEKRVLYEASRR